MLNLDEIVVNMYFKSIRLLISKMVTPVIMELPVMLVFFIFIKGSLLEFFKDNDYDNAWDYLSAFGIYFIYAYFIALSITLLKKAWVRWLWYIVLFIIFALSCFIAVNFDMKIGPTLITLLVETNGREAGEFLGTYLFTSESFKVYVKIIFYVFFVALLEIGYRKFILSKAFLHESLIASIAICIFILLGLSRWGWYFYNVSKPDGENLDFPASDNYTRLICSLIIESKQADIINRAIDVSLNSSEATLIRKEDSLNVILVIGESFNKHHASLYGYSLTTTPNLQSQKEKGNLYDFLDVVTSYNYTSMSLKNMMSCNSISDSEIWSDYPYFPVLFKKAGFDVYFWSNQHESSNGSVFEYALNSYLYNPRLLDYSYTMINKHTFEYDGQLVDDFNNQILSSQKELGPNNLFLFHLMGQHTVYKSRFPNTDAHIRFTANDIHRNDEYLNKEKLQYIADYDNAIFYNDEILAKIINMFAGSNAVLVFLSDHGEEVFDFRDRMGRSYTDSVSSSFLKYQYEVPFVIWCSDIFKVKYPDLMKDISSAVSKPFMIDNLCQLLFHLGGIMTEYYHPQRDPLSSDYISKVRIVRGDVNYDEMRINK